MSSIEEKGQSVYMYVGSYTNKSDAGVSLYRLDTGTGETQLLQTVTTIKNASFLTTDAQTERFYAVSEVQEVQGQLGGEVVSYERDSASGLLRELNRQRTLGKDPCYVSVLNEKQSRLLLATNYSSGSVSVFPLSGSGDLVEPLLQLISHEGASRATERQLGPHTHSAVIHPEGKYVVVSDLGQDKLIVYRWDAGVKQLVAHSETAAAEGAGPRHFVFHPERPYAYGINELNNTITAYAFDGEEGKLTTLESVPTLPADFTGSNTSADLHLDPSGRFLYGSNRGHNSIVVYRIDLDSGQLTYVEHTSTHGSSPRNFAIAPGGKLLLAANQQTDTIEVFQLDPINGRLTHDASRSIAVAEPVCIHIV